MSEANFLIENNPLGDSNHTHLSCKLLLGGGIAVIAPACAGINHVCNKWKSHKWPPACTKCLTGRVALSWNRENSCGTPPGIDGTQGSKHIWTFSPLPTTTDTFPFNLARPCWTPFHASEIWLREVLRRSKEGHQSLPQLYLAARIRAIKTAPTNRAANIFPLFYSHSYVN